MQQVLSNKQTIYTQTLLSVVVTAALLYLAWFEQIGPSWGYQGLIGPVAYVWIILLVSVSIVGALMHGINLIFYRIQVYRHGLPHEDIEIND